MLKLMSSESVMPCNHLILGHPLLLLPSIFLNIRVFSNESPLHTRWPSIGVSASASLQPHGLQHVSPPCPSPTPGGYSNLGPLRSLICLPAILIPICASSSPAFLMMHSAYKLNKQVTIYSFDVFFFQFGTSLFFYVQF